MATKVDIGRLQSIGNRLGEAVIDPAMWPLLMADVCSASGATGACLLQSDIRTPDVPMTASAREFFKSYFDNHLHENDIRAARGVPLLLAGRQVVTDQDLFTSEVRNAARSALRASGQLRAALVCGGGIFRRLRAMGILDAADDRRGRF